MLRCYLMDPDTDVCQTEQPQISYSVDFTAEQSSAMESPILILLAVGVTVADGPPSTKLRIAIGYNLTYNPATV